MKRWIAVIALLLALAPGALAQEFHIVASRRAVVRAEPRTDAEARARLDRGDAAFCFTDEALGQPRQQDGFYRVRLQDGRLGWVSRFVVRPFEGPVPGVIPAVGETAAEANARDRHLAIGAPRGYMQLINEAYVVGYDPRLKIPAWVQYRLTAEDIAVDRPRSNAFEIDVRIPEPGRATLTDYETAASWALWAADGLRPAAPEDGTPNYARGHMAPARDLARTEEIEESSYLLSNMAPQIHNGFNNGAWSTLERRVRSWTEARGELTIICGPVFESCERQLRPQVDEADRLEDADEAMVLAQPSTERQVIYNVVGDGEVAVPTAFFKVIVDDENEDHPDVLAFVIPHHRHEGPDLADFLVSVREVERATGLDLLSALPDDVESAVEDTRAMALW